MIILFISKMKIFLIILLLITPLLIYGDEDNLIDFDFISSDPVGALLFADNCLGCHQPASFIVSEPDEDYVEELAERIDYNIYSPMTGMSHLDFLTFSESMEIARFLVYGTHVKGWLSQGFHGEIVEEMGSGTCMECHENDRIKRVEIPGCSECH